QRIPLAKPGILPSVEELERLYEELDFPDAADTELDVPALGILAAKRVVDGPLHLTDLVHDTGVEARAEHERPDQVEETGRDTGISRAEPVLDERLPLP